MDLGFQLAKLAGAFVLVLALLYATMYGLKRWGHWVRKGGTESLIRVTGRHAFGPKHFLMVVEVGTQRFLVGVSPQGMQMLAPLEAEAVDAARQDEAKA
jgi:flagellar biosynthetic protein FliO